MSMIPSRPAVAAWAMATTLAPGAVLHVPGDYESIQCAIDEASEQDTILVAPGTYRENIILRGGARGCFRTVAPHARSYTGRVTIP